MARIIQFVNHGRTADPLKSSDSRTILVAF
jgi:hypothetical protein